MSFRAIHSGLKKPLPVFLLMRRWTVESGQGGFAGDGFAGGGLQDFHFGFAHELLLEFGE
jgi:hypothetical protein